MPGAQIVSTGGYLPGEPITNDDIERLIGPVPAGLLESMKMRDRYWVVDAETGEHRDSTSGMATKAIRQALERAALAPDDLDLLVVATASPDYMLPPTVALVQEQLGIARCATLDLRSGGAGVVQGLDIARMYLERGVYRTAAVVGCDAISPLQAQYFMGKSKVRTRERLLVYMFGDGAGAVIMQASDEGAVIGCAHACIGTGMAPGMTILGGGGTHEPYVARLERQARTELLIDLEQASTFTATLTTEALRDLLATTGLRAEQIDHCITPEADTEWMTEALSENQAGSEEWAALASNVRNSLPEVGAPGSAALPLGLDRAWVSGQLRPGDCVALLAMETTKWIYAAMAVRWTAPAPRSVAPAGADHSSAGPP